MEDQATREVDEASVEAELLRRVALGDRAAFDELYARYSRPLFAYILKFLKDRMLAEEVLQDAFVKIWKTAFRYDPKLSRPFSWSVLVTKRLCIDRLRAMKPVTVAEDPLALQPLDRRDAGERSPSEAALVRDEIGILRRQLDKLPDSQRQSLLLAMGRGLTQQEISEELNMPLGSVKTAMRRGMLRLKQLMATNSYE